MKQISTDQTSITKIKGRGRPSTGHTFKQITITLPLGVYSALKTEANIQGLTLPEIYC